jgi:hypothetical protein
MWLYVMGAAISAHGPTDRTTDGRRADSASTDDRHPDTHMIHRQHTGTRRTEVRYG